MANKRVNDDGSMKAVIYARYSSENQREESIDGQIRECYAFARKNNISVIAEYIDRAFSAKTDRRPDFQRMIKDSTKKNFNLVLVWKLDRFARNRYDSANYKATLKRNGVKVMSVTESISEGSEGILLESVLEGMAEYYSAELSEKVLRGHHENALKCRYNGGTLPIGFSIDKDKNYNVDPITSPYIVEAFTMYDEGRTMKEIVAVLNQHGLKNQRGGELNLNSVSRLLQNRFYIGEYKYREVLVPDGIPAIIPKDLFDRVQEKLAKNKKAPARHKAEDDYLLTTKLFCGDCQSLMFGESGTSQSGATYHYYKCSSAKKKTGCNRKPVKKKWIEDAVLDQVKVVLHDDVFIGDIVHKYLEYQQQENTVIPYLEKNLSDTQRSIDNLIAAIEQGIITPSTKQRLETLEVAKRELEDKILIENMKRPLRTEDELWAWFRYMRNFDLTRLEERRQLIDVFVNTVFLYNDRFLLTLNFGYGSKTVLFTDIPCSDKVACGRPNKKIRALCSDFFILIEATNLVCDFTSRTTKLYHRALCLERDRCLWQIKGARQGKKQGESQPAGRESTMFLTERGRRSRKFAFAARRSTSSLVRRRACESSRIARIPCHLSSQINFDRTRT